MGRGGDGQCPGEGVPTASLPDFRVAVLAGAHGWWRRFRCRQFAVGETEAAPAPPSSSAPLRWLLFVSLAPVLLGCGFAGRARALWRPAESPVGVRAGGALCRPFPPTSRAGRELGFGQTPGGGFGGAATPKGWGSLGAAG